MSSYPKNCVENVADNVTFYYVYIFYLNSYLL